MDLEVRKRRGPMAEQAIDGVPVAHHLCSLAALSRRLWLTVITRSELNVI